MPALVPKPTTIQQAEASKSPSFPARARPSNTPPGVNSRLGLTLAKKKIPNSASHRVEQIFKPCLHRLLCQLMKHQRKGRKGHQLIKHIQGNQIGREIYPHQNPFHHQVKSKKTVFIMLMLHIRSGIDSYQEPHKRRKPCKQPAYIIYPKRNIYGIR